MESTQHESTRLRPWSSTVHLEVTGHASPDEVWDRYAVLARWPEWSPQITGVNALQDRLSPGMRGTVHGPLGVGLPFVVTDVDEAARRWSWQVRVGPLRLRLVHGVQPDGSGTRTTLTSSGPTALVLAYAPVARWALRRLVSPEL